MSGSLSLLKSILRYLTRRSAGSDTPASSAASSPASSGKTVSISPAGISLIKHYEGCELTAYRDASGVLTIGYGDTGDVTPGQTITQAEADARLRVRLDDEFVPGVLGCLGVPAMQCELDAMVSLAYNVGVAAFAGSTLVRKFNAGDKQGAADEFPRWNLAGGKVLRGLVRRRAAERALFLGANLRTAISIGDAS